MNKAALLERLKRLKFSEKIIDAFSIVRREDFIDPKFLSFAYEDSPLPLGEGSTISQPYTIAFMLTLLDLRDSNKILEIGSGCGYVLAIINEMIQYPEIFGVEINEDICRASIVRFQNYQNVSIFYQDGKFGLPQYAPFDRILISAACPEKPYHLLDQLNDNGIIVASVQDSIYKIEKSGDEVLETEYPGFRFVPLV